MESRTVTVVADKHLELLVRVLLIMPTGWRPSPPFLIHTAQKKKSRVYSQSLKPRIERGRVMGTHEGVSLRPGRRVASVN